MDAAVSTISFCSQGRGTRISGVVAVVAGGENAADGQQVVADGTVGGLGDEDQFCRPVAPSFLARVAPMTTAPVFCRAQVAAGDQLVVEAGDLRLLHRVDAEQFDRVAAGWPRTRPKARRRGVRPSSPVHVGQGRQVGRAFRQVGVQVAMVMVAGGGDTRCP